MNLFENKLTIFLIIITLSTFLAGCGGGGGSVSNIYSSSNDANAIKPAVLTSHQNLFVNEAKADYAINPDSPQANFKMAIAESFLNLSNNGELNTLSNNLYQDGKEISPTLSDLMKTVVSKDGYSPSVTFSSGLNIAAAIIKLNAFGTTTTFAKLQDTIQDFMIPALDKEISYLRKCETASFQYTNTRLYFKKLFKINDYVASDPLDNTEYMLDQSDAYILDGLLLLNKSAIHFACAFNFDATQSTDVYNDVTNVFKLRDSSNPAGKGAANLKAARENFALSLEKISIAAGLRMQNPAITKKLFWDQSSGGQAFNLIKTQLGYIVSALRAGGSYKLSSPELSSSAYIMVNFSAWENNPGAVDLKIYLKALNAMDSQSTDTASYDFSLGGLFPECTSKQAANNKIDGLKQQNLGATLNEWQTIMGNMQSGW